MSTSARKPRGPTAMLVGIPNKRYFIGALGDFLDLLLNMVLIHVDVRERAARLLLHSLTRRDEGSSQSLVLQWESATSGLWQFELHDRVSHAQFSCCIATGSVSVDLSTLWNNSPGHIILDNGVSELVVETVVWGSSPQSERIKSVSLDLLKQLAGRLTLR